MQLAEAKGFGVGVLSTNWRRLATSPEGASPLAGMLLRTMRSSPGLKRVAVFCGERGGTATKRLVRNPCSSGRTFVPAVLPKYFVMDITFEDRTISHGTVTMVQTALPDEGKTNVRLYVGNAPSDVELPAGWRDIIRTFRLEEVWNRFSGVTTPVFGFWNGPQKKELWLSEGPWCDGAINPDANFTNEDDTYDFGRVERFVAMEGGVMSDPSITMETVRERLGIVDPALSEVTKRILESPKLAKESAGDAHYLG